MPPSGPLYAPTARFPEEEFERSFSVMFRFLSERDERLEQAVELDILALDLVDGRLRPGTTLSVLEGDRLVAYCHLTEILAPQE